MSQIIVLDSHIWFWWVNLECGDGGTGCGRGSRREPFVYAQSVLYLAHE